MADPIDVLSFPYTDVLATEGTVFQAGDTYFGPFNMRTFKGVRLDCDRTADSGTTTMVIALVFMDQATGDYRAVEDLADGAVVINDYADGETGWRFIVVHPELGLGTDADGVLAVGTTNTYYQLPMPPEFYVKVTTTAAGTNTAALSLGFLN